MASENSATIPQDASATKGAEEVQAKGKGKATEQPVDTAMDEDDDEEDEDEEEVRYSSSYHNSNFQNAQS